MYFEQYSDNCRIISSGCFLLKSKDSNARLHINLRPEYNFEMDLVWTFKENNIENTANVTLGDHNDNFLELVITNANNPFGNGTLRPNEIAEFYDGKKLYCNYFFSRPDENNPRLFTYSLYIER